MSEEFDVAAALERIFDADTGIYGSRGFQRRVGFGARPALAAHRSRERVDAARVTRSPATAWTRSSRRCSG